MPGTPVVPPDVREGRFPVPGAELYFREIGSGTPRVALHGGPDFNHSYFLPELDRLAIDSRLVYYDQRGRGRSSHGVRAEDVTIESEVDDLDRLRRHLGVEAMQLLGHSWGAVLAMEYATRHPERVSRLIVMNTAPASHADLLLLRERREAAEADRLAGMRAISRTAAFTEGDVAAEAEYCRLHFGGTLRDPDQLESIIGRLRVDFTPADIVKARAIEHRLREQTWLRADYDLLARLRPLELSTLVIHGDRDLIPVECARHVAEAASGSRLIVLEDCGHFAYLERPEEVRRAIVGPAAPGDSACTST